MKYQYIIIDAKTNRKWPKIISSSRKKTEKIRKQLVEKNGKDLYLCKTWRDHNGIVWEEALN